MSGAYFDAMRDGLTGVLDLFLKIALPLAIFLGLLLAAAIIAFALKGSSWSLDWSNIHKWAMRWLGYAATGLVVVCLWSALKQVQPRARDDIEWKESAEASDNPAPEAPPIDQYGPVAANMVDKNYRKTISLPPEFLQRIGAEGIGVLSPYLIDPTAESVLKLVDTFRRSGQDVVFTREVMREDEEPLPFDSSEVKVAIHRLQEQAYVADFDAVYTFSNPASTTVKVRFLYALPRGGGTVQELKVMVAGQSLSEPDEEGTYKWTGLLAPGEKRQATVHYQATGAKNWSYDLGSNRRRVKVFNLQAKVDGPVQFLKGSIQPSSHSGGTIGWQLTDVVTSQRLALTFPPDVRLRESYLQALAVLPATLSLFLIGVFAAAIRLGGRVAAGQMVLALVLFGFGLGTTAVLANYVGPVLATFAGPVGGALLAGAVLGRRYLFVALPVALLPACSLSPKNTGLWVVLLALAGAGCFLWMLREHLRGSASATS